MNESDTTQEVTTIENQTPAQVVKKTTRQVEPQARGEAPQKVYDKKKTILRFNQIIWYILCLIEVLLVFRIALKALGANSFSGFTSLIYAISDPLALPFRGILTTNVTAGSVFEWSTIIAGIVYLCIAWGLVYLLDLIYPITPKDVESQ
ncbi:MAG: YggT family protein [bacterium]|nr:YggT family protein [bacterium]